MPKKNLLGAILTILQVDEHYSQSQSDRCAKQLCHFLSLYPESDQLNFLRNELNRVATTNQWIHSAIVQLQAKTQYKSVKSWIESWVKRSVHSDPVPVYNEQDWQCRRVDPLSKLWTFVYQGEKHSIQLIYEESFLWGKSFDKSSSITSQSRSRRTTLWTYIASNWTLNVLASSMGLTI